MSANQWVMPYLDDLTELYFDFQPDIIIEATNACNRACHGCYAANILVNSNQVSRAAKFLQLADLERAMSGVGDLAVTSIRGGEPSIHPHIDKILKIVSEKSKISILETHGRWITLENQLLEVCKDLGIWVKVSFDTMHGLSADQLYKMQNLLEQKSVNYLVAITESSYSDFMTTRALCAGISDKHIIFQKKAQNLDELIRPRVGVIKSDGILSKTLSVKTKLLSVGKYD